MKTLAQYSETPGLSINVTLFNRQLLHEDVNGILGEFTNNAVISYQEKRILYWMLFEQLKNRCGG